MTIVKPVKVRKGLYKLEGVIDTVPRRTGAMACGGQVFAEFFEGSWDGDEKLPDGWECYCEKCLDCDCNGWPTLRDCVRNARSFWCESTGAA